MKDVFLAQQRSGKIPLMKVLIITSLAVLILLINIRTLLKDIKSRQSIVYFLLLLTGWALAWIYTFEINLQSPFQTIEAVLEPVNDWLWG
jgi:glucan phosphoethanolaminetransferase (alkaline phosphatase superfamily)